MKRLILGLALALGLTAAAHAQSCPVATPVTCADCTTVADTLHAADSTLANGNLTISWPTFLAADNQVVAAGCKTIAIRKGVLSTLLQPTTTASPSTTYYTVVYTLNGSPQNTREFWAVPDTGTATLAAVRTINPAAPGPVVSLSWLDVSTGVDGNCIVRSAGAATWAACPGSGGSTAFSALVGGTNTGAAMLVGSGASLSYTGTGTININKISGVLLSGLGTGIVKLASGTPSLATSADIRGLWSGTCDVTVFLRGDGTCADPSAIGGPANYVYATPNGSMGDASLRALVAADIPSPLTSNTSGNAATATALAANPTDCSSGQYANTIAANGNLTCTAVTDAQLSTSDITTNNASTSKHGFMSKLPNDATKYYDGTGVFSVPAGGTGCTICVIGTATFSASGGTIASKTVAGVISNVTRSGVGTYSVVFTGSQSNYTVAVYLNDNSSAWPIAFTPGTNTTSPTSALGIGVVDVLGAANFDPDWITVTIFK